MGSTKTWFINKPLISKYSHFRNIKNGLFSVFLFQHEIVDLAKPHFYLYQNLKLIYQIKSLNFDFFRKRNIDDAQEDEETKIKKKKSRSGFGDFSGW